MVSKYSFRKLTWIDLESPNRDEVATLLDTYKLSELVGDSMLTPTLRSKVDVYPNSIYLILHFPIMGKGKKAGAISEQEIDFIIGKDFIITAHYEKIAPLQEFAKQFEANSPLDKSMVATHAGFLFFYMIKALYDNSMTELEDINHSLHIIERDVFAGKEEDMVKVISNVNRLLVDFKQAIRFHRETLRSFESAGAQFFGNEFSYYLAAVTGEYNKVQNILDGHKEILDDLRGTNDSLITSRTNDIVKRLTIMSFIMMPLTLITGVFGMNTDMTYIRTFSDFLMVLLAMSAIATVMFTYFKRKRWF